MAIQLGIIKVEVLPRNIPLCNVSTSSLAQDTVLKARN